MSENSTRRSIAAGPANADRALFSSFKLAVLPLGALVSASALLLAACPVEPEPINGNGDNGSTRCIFDFADTAGDAESIEDGEEITGFLCPEGDEDWFRLRVPASGPLVSLSLAMDGTLSPVSPTYVIRAEDSGAAGTVVATPPPLRASGEHDDVHCLDAGDYFVQVRDRSGDSEDRRRPYKLVLSTSAHPDPAPITHGPEEARALTSGQTVQGWVACSGESNWWEITAAGRRVASLRFERDQAEWAPSIRIQDSEGSPLLTASDPSGPVAATLIERFVVLPEAGSYFVQIASSDGVSSDPDVSYSLSIELMEDLDPNEPNDTPAEATALPPRSCGGSWSTLASTTGTFGVPGDQDWFRLALDGCGRGVLEATVELDTSSLTHEEAWQLQEKLQASMTLFRPHPASSCESGTDCALLQQACNSDWDCAGYGNLCVSGRCSGGMVCLGEGVCGASMVQRSYQRASVPSTITGPPPPNRVVLSVPLFGDPYVYLNVSDWQADGAAPDLLYTLEVRVRADPDTNEPSNIYLPDRRERSDSVRRQLDAARARSRIPVRDCTSGDCCGPSTWIEGAISYELDEDYYAYNHPCPGEDCMVRILYELDGGPVDFLFSVYRNNSLWFDGFTGTQQQEVQPARSGALGGLGATDSCFYAFRNHTGYVLSVRDLLDVHDWDSDQRYRFCIEKIANECLEPPCRLIANCAQYPCDPDDPATEFWCDTP